MRYAITHFADLFSCCKLRLNNLGRRLKSEEILKEFEPVLTQIGRLQCSRGPAQGLSLYIKLHALNASFSNLIESKPEGNPM